MKIKKIIIITIFLLIINCSYNNIDNPIKGTCIEIKDSIPNWISDTSFSNDTLFINLNDYIINNH